MNVGVYILNCIILFGIDHINNSLINSIISIVLLHTLNFYCAIATVKDVKWHDVNVEQI